MAASSAQSLLARPVSQRILEYRYRFAQSAVFGLPVLVLQWFGHSLGGSPQESQRWVAILQALLTGWVVYVGATGMLIEGLMLASTRITADLPVAIAAIGLYLFSLVSTIGVFFVGRPFFQPLLFHVVILLLMLWCAMKWAILSRRNHPEN